jgi:hypothetical protein
MPIRTNFKDKKTFHKELLNSVNKLLENHEKIDIALTEKLYPIEKDNYQFIARLLKTDFKNRTEHMFMSLLFKDIYRTEILSAKAGQISFIFALHFIRNLLKSQINLDNETELFKEWENVLNKFKTNIENISCIANEKDIYELIENICQDKTLTDVCWQALQSAGLEGKIFIENTKNECFIVESKDGYSFDLKPYNFFLTNNLWQSKECKALVVDGFVENISEMDQLLNSAHEHGQPLVIVAHGFSEEVVATLYTNFQRKTLNVIPLRVKTDVNNINVINDISVVCGMEPISSLKGQLLTFVKWEDLPVVNKISVTQNKTNFDNSRAVSNQIIMLLEKRQDNHIIEDIQDLLDSRIKNLTANSVIINLPNMSTIKLDEHRVKLDNCLRQTKTILNYGLLPTDKLNDLVEKTESNLEKVLYKSFSDVLVKEKYPLLSVYLAAHITGKTLLMILSSAGRVEFDY